jgi:hypothetical protein
MDVDKNKLKVVKKIILIEWAEKFKDYYNLRPDLQIDIEHKNENERNILIKWD